MAKVLQDAKLTPITFSCQVKLQASLLEERDPGVLLGLVTLLLGVVARSYEGFEALAPRLVRLLERLAAKDVPADFAYYGIPSPWLQVRVFRLQAVQAPSQRLVVRCQFVHTCACPWVLCGSSYLQDLLDPWVLALRLT